MCIPFENRIARYNVTDTELSRVLDIDGYYHQCLGKKVPGTMAEIRHDLEEEGFLVRGHITNYGVLMIGATLIWVKGFERKTVRIKRYDGYDKIRSDKEYMQGYALSLPDILRDVEDYGEAVRELIVNMVIHQDLEISGIRPKAEFFSDRIEFTNAGRMSVNPMRLVDTVPVSVNEHTASFIHRCGMCEERGAGYDRIMHYVIENKLRAPKVEDYGGWYTKVTLYTAESSFRKMTSDEEVYACYMTACYKHENTAEQTMYVSDVGDPFIIRNTVNAGLIKPASGQDAYVPYWA